MKRNIMDVEEQTKTHKTRKVEVEFVDMSSQTINKLNNNKKRFNKPMERNKQTVNKSMERKKPTLNKPTRVTRVAKKEEETVSGINFERIFLEERKLLIIKKNSRNLARAL